MTTTITKLCPDCGVEWCKVVHPNKGTTMANKALDAQVIRQSISFSKQQHEALSRIAEKNNVSICWVVRHACDLMLKECGEQRTLHNLPVEMESRGTSS